MTEHPEVDFVQIQLNYLDWKNDTIQSRKCYETAKRHRKPVIVMEPVKGGILADIPQKAENLFRTCRPDLSVVSWAIRFAASHENVMLVLSGMSDLEQVKDNLSYMENFTPFTKEEYTLVQKAADIINGSIAIPCTGCAYCINNCPKNIAVPKYFFLYNADMRELEDCTNNVVQPFFGTVWKSKQLHRVRTMRKDVPAAHSYPRMAEKSCREI